MSIVFAQLKDRCTNLLRHVKQIQVGKSVDYDLSRNELDCIFLSTRKEIETLTATEAEHFFHYIVIPLKIFIEIYKISKPKAYLTQNHATMASQCLLAVFKQTSFRGTLRELTELFLFPILSRKMNKSSDLDRNKTTLLSQDYQSALLQCLSELYRPFHDKTLIIHVDLLDVAGTNNENHLPAKMTQKQFSSFAGVIIGTLLDLANDSPYRNVQIDSLHALTAFCGALINGSNEKPSNCKQILSQFLPGLTEGLLSIINGDYKRGSTVFSLSATLWGNILCALFQDLSSPSDDFTETWVQASLSKMNVAFQRIYSTIVSMDQQLHWKRIDVINIWASELLDKCGKVFYSTIEESKREKEGTCTTHLINVLLLTLQHPHKDIQQRAARSLLTFSVSNEFAFFDILSDNMNEFLMKHPHTMRKETDEQKCAQITLLQNLLALLGHRIEELLWNLLNDLCEYLCQVCTLYAYGIHFSHFAVHQTRLDLNTPNLVEAQQYPKKTFLNFRDEKIYKVVCNVCQLIGFHTKTNRIFDFFLDLLNTPSHPYRIQACMIMNQFIIGRCCIHPHSLLPMGDDNSSLLDSSVPSSHIGERNRLNESYVSLLLEEYLSQSPFSPVDLSAPPEEALGPASGIQASSTLTKAQQKILFTCCLLEGIGNFAVCIGKPFQLQLIDVLLPLFKKLGDINGLISDYAWVTLNKICVVCGYKNISVLIQDNSDYLIDSIAAQMKYIQLYPDTPKALRALLLYADEKVLPLIGDMTTDSLRALDGLHADLTESLIQVLYQILVVLLKIRTIVPKEFLPLPADDESDPHSTLPPAMMVVAQILDKIQYYIASKDKFVKVKSLDILQLAVELLTKDFSSVLLPLIHKCWSPLLYRCKEKDLVIVVKSLEVIEVLTTHAKDYLRPKLLKELWPIIKEALFNAYKRQNYSVIKDTVSVEMSDAYKVQKRILVTLKQILLSVPKLPLAFIDEVTQYIIIYLSDLPFNHYAQECIGVFEGLMQQNPDCVWLALGSLCNIHMKAPILHDGNSLCDISFPPFKLLEVWKIKKSKEEEEQLVFSCQRNAKDLFSVVEAQY